MLEATRDQLSPAAPVDAAQPERSIRSHQHVLRAVRRHGPLTLRQIRGYTGLSHAAVAASIGLLREQGVIAGGGTRRAEGLGRPSTLWQLRAEAAALLGIDVGASGVRAVVLDMSGTVIHREREATVALLARIPDSRHVARELAAFGRRTLAASPVQGTRLVAAGVAVSGLVDGDRGMCLSCANIPGWRDLRLAADLSALLGVDVSLDDSACAHALAEHHIGVARGARDFLLVNVGIGIGAALFIDGRIYRGPGGLAGELGHITVDERGPLCGCGNHGCAEALVGGPAIVRRAQELLAVQSFPSLLNADGRAPLTVEYLAGAAAAGDTLAFRVLNEAGEHLGVAIAAALNLLGSPLVVLGGGVVQAGAPFLSAVQRTVLLRALPPVAQQARVVPSVLSDDAAACGAALTALDRYLATVI